MNEYRVTVKIRNHLLLVALERSAFKTVAKLCEATGISNALVYDYINLKRIPIDERGYWRPSALRLSEAIGVLPDEIFHESQYEAIKKNKAEFVAGLEDIGRLMSVRTPLDLLEEKEQAAAIWEFGDILTPREKKVLQLRFIEQMTYEQVGELFEVTRERARQIEQKAFRKLRCPRGAKKKLWAVKNGLEPHFGGQLDDD